MTQTQRIVDTGNGSAAMDEVRRLLSLDKCKQAVELAKENHKRLQSADSQQLLIDAYTARIEQFQAKGALEDARTLIKLVSDRFPAHRSALVALQVRSAAAEGKTDDLVAPLNDPNISAEMREMIESAIRRDLIDLPSLANCKSLPPDHSLRTSAAAIWKAFEAATTIPVTDEQVSLPEVSRRSPLAGWKLFVRAMAAFYRNDDEACRRSLESIAPDAAVAKLGKALVVLLEEKPVVAPQGIAATIRQRVLGDERAFRDSLDKLERAFTSYDESLLTRSLRSALQACNASRPDLFERLRQHCSIRGMMYDVPVELIRHVTGPALKEAYYWRLAAMACEKTGSNLSAATWWERFLRHGIAEGMFADKGKEAAMVYLRIANLLSDTGRQFRRHDLAERLKSVRDMYRGQPPEITRLMPSPDSEEFRNAADANWNFRRSVELWPDSQAFSKWRQWTEKQRNNEKQLQLLAEVWRRKLPADPQAPLLLAKMAESRKAFSLALRHLADAEAIDAMNPEVRKARLRLTLGTTFRHFKDKKPHLIEKDLAELAAMPAMREGDRPALLDALRAGMIALQPSGAEAAQAAVQGLIDRIGSEMTCMLMGLILFNTKMSKPEHWPKVIVPDNLEPPVAADAAARSFLLSSGLKLVIPWTPRWEIPIKSALRERPCGISSAHLLALGGLGVIANNAEQAYLASSAGLESAAGTTAARFLLLRAQSLPQWAYPRRHQCLRAAMELARPANDAILIDAIAAEKNRHSYMHEDQSAPTALSNELVAEIIKQERSAVDFPKNQADVGRYLVTIDSEVNRRSFFGGDSPFGMVDDFDDDDEEDEFDDDDYDDGVPFGAGFTPPQRESPAVKEFMDQFGGRKPTPQEMFSNPDLAARVLRELGLGNVDPEVIKEMFGSSGPFSSQGKKKKNKR